MLVCTTVSSEVKHSPTLSHIDVSIPAENVDIPELHDNADNLHVENHDEHAEPEADELHDYQLARDKVRRNIRKPIRFNDCNLLAFAFYVFEAINSNEPKSYQEALKSVNFTK